MGAEEDVQAALYTALSGYAPLVTTMGAAVVDSATQPGDGGAATPYPYVEVGFIALSEWDTAHDTGFDFIARIHSRSRSAGALQAKRMQGAIYARLHRGALTMTSHRLIDLQRQTSDVDRVADGQFHGVCEYRGLIEAI